MPTYPAENAFRKGLAALSDGRHVEAAVHFESAMTLERQRGTVRTQMRYLSYYGLSMAMASRPTPEAIRACELAARRDFFNAELQLNLGKVYLRARKLTRALAAFERGLQLDPRNVALRTELARVDRRRRPPIGWIRRSHPLNCFLGRIRFYLTGRASS